MNLYLGLLCLWNQFFSLSFIQFITSPEYILEATMWYLNGIKKKPKISPKDLLAPPRAPRTSMMVKAFLVALTFFSVKKKFTYQYICINGPYFPYYIWVGALSKVRYFLVSAGLPIPEIPTMLSLSTISFSCTAYSQTPTIYGVLPDRYIISCILNLTISS